MIAACKPRQLLQLSRVALLISAVLAMTACVDERAFFIVGATSECVDGENLASGILDVSEGQGYVFSPEVRNAMLSTEQLDKEPERNILVVEGFEVDLDIPEEIADASLTKTFTYASGIVEPAGGSTVFTNVPIISKELVQRVPLAEGAEQVVVATIRARASHNGSTLKSVEFNFPVRLCNGCLVADVGDCPATKPQGVVTNACGLPQDSPVVCCAPAAGGGQRVCLDSDQLNALPESTTTP